METTETEYTTERIDRRGIVAGIYKQIGPIEIIDGAIIPGRRSKANAEK